MRPKLSQVAELAGVSEATVSRVINGKPGVAESTRRAVLDVLSDLGYREVPSRSGGTGIVGIITPELENPIFPLIAQTIESRLARHELMSLVCPSTSETIAEQDYLDHFVAARAAGIVVVNGRYAQDGFGFEPYERVMAAGIPIVLLNGLAADCSLPAVSVDLRAAARLAVQHLVRLGHVRIGCLTGPSRYTTSQLFVAGYRDAMAAGGIGNEVISETLFTLEGGRAGMAKLLEDGCTGVVAASDLMAIGAITAARSWGVSVPADVSVIGSDGTPMTMLTDPPLTTLRQPVGRMAAATASALVAQRNGDAMLGAQLFQPELVAGASAAPAPITASSRGLHRG